MPISNWRFCQRCIIFKTYAMIFTMKTKAFQILTSLQKLSIVERCLAILLIFGGSFSSQSQTTGKAPSQVGKSQDTLNPGYLSKSAPSGLRFAPPPKPPVAYLPPLSISHNPQPVFNSEFAQPIADLPTPPIPNSAPTPPPITVVPFTELTTIFTNKDSKVPESPVDPGAVSPQMLIRFFADEKPGTRKTLDTPVFFRVPVNEETPTRVTSNQLK
jgi:hypothetical protein